MSTNHLNDISRVYLAQVAEETPGERIDRISQADVAKRKASADADKAAKDKKTAEFQKHKQSVLAKGGRPVDALDSWHKKQAHKEAYSLAEESAVEKKKETLLKIKKDAKDILKQDEIHSKIENEEFKPLTPDKKRTIRNQAERRKKSADRAQMASDYTTSTKQDQQVRKMKKVSEGEFKPLTSEGANMLKDKEGHTTGGFRISNKEASAAKDRLHKNRRISIKMGSAGQELAKMEKDDDAFGAPKAKKVKKESFSDWRNDLREIVAEPEEKAEKEVTEKKVKNKVIINPTFQEAISDIGGEVLDAVEIDEVKVTKLDDKKKKEDKDKKVKAMLARQAEWENAKKKALHASHEPEGENLDEKDSYKTVAAVIDYDRSKKGSKDATYDSEHGKKKAAKKERDYAAWEREKMKRDDPNWKHKKYHTGMHGESVEADEYIEVVGKVKKSELESDLKRWGFEEVESLGK